MRITLKRRPICVVSFNQTSSIFSLFIYFFLRPKHSWRPLQVPLTSNLRCMSPNFVRKKTKYIYWTLCMSMHTIVYQRRRWFSACILLLCKFEDVGSPVASFTITWVVPHDIKFRFKWVGIVTILANPLFLEL